MVTFVNSCIFVIFSRLVNHLKPLGNRYKAVNNKILTFLLVFFICVLTMLDLEDTTLQLDIRVTILEENGGSDSNSSVAELEVRVESLEGTAADHEARITLNEENIQGNELYLSPDTLPRSMDWKQKTYWARKSLIIFCCKILELSLYQSWIVSVLIQDCSKRMSALMNALQLWKKIWEAVLLMVRYLYVFLDSFRFIRFSLVKGKVRGFWKCSGVFMIIGSRSITDFYRWCHR